MITKILVGFPVLSMMSSGGKQQSLRKALGTLKDSTQVGLAKVNSEYKVLSPPSPSPYCLSLSLTFFYLSPQRMLTLLLSKPQTMKRKYQRKSTYAVRFSISPRFTLFIYIISYAKSHCFIILQLFLTLFQLQDLELTFNTALIHLLDALGKLITGQYVLS